MTTNIPQYVRTTDITNENHWTMIGYIPSVGDAALLAVLDVSTDNLRVAEGAAKAWCGSGTMTCILSVFSERYIWLIVDERGEVRGFVVARSRTDLLDDDNPDDEVLINQAMLDLHARRQAQVDEIMQLLDAPIGTLESDSL